MKKKITISVLIFLVFLVIAQFIPIKKPDVPPHSVQHDFIAATAPPEPIANMIRNACYDCHSFETVYPWYAKVAPVSWWIFNHVKEGRHELNFSEWGQYNDRRKTKKMHECNKEIEHGKMPLAGYPLIHKNARLSDEQKEELRKWFDLIAEKESGITPK